MKSADIIVIGAGPGGYEAALEASRKGLSVILFNGSHLGGTCLNEGCIPTKCLCRNAEMISNFKNGEEFGIDDFTFSVDYGKIRARKQNVIETLRGGIAALMTQAKVEVVDAVASFKDSRTVVANGEEYTARNIIIASGSVSKSLPIPGHDLPCVFDSTDMLDVDFIPESLTVIGGGVIGLEFASIFSSLGTKVTVIEFMKQVLPPFDSDIAKRLKQSLAKKGIKILTSAAAKKIEQLGEGEIAVTYEAKGKEETVVSTNVLMAVGRAPRLDTLNLEAAGVEYTPKGIVVDDNMKTNVDGIYAIGDVNGRMMLAHVATFQGFRAVHHICGESDEIRFDVVPSAVFTVPECGMVGKTEEQCKAEGLDIMVGQSFFRSNGKSLAMAETEGLCKLIFRRDNGLLIGAHIMGVEAADLAQQCADLMNCNATLYRMRDIIFSHPSVSEVIMSACHNVK